MKIIDIDTWKRRDHFLHFRRLDFPYLNLTANVEISKLLTSVKLQHLSLFATMAYIATRSADEITELRYRIRGDQVVEHEHVRPSFTVLSSDETFGFATIDYAQDFPVFHKRVLAAIESTRSNPDIHDEPGRDDMIFLTSITWISFTQINHPVPLNPPDSFPRIAWGKFFQQGNSTLLPLSLCANHALVDGLQIGRFFESVQILIDHSSDFL